MSNPYFADDSRSSQHTSSHSHQPSNASKTSLQSPQDYSYNPFNLSATPSDLLQHNNNNNNNNNGIAPTSPTRLGPTSTSTANNSPVRTLPGFTTGVSGAPPFGAALTHGLYSSNATYSSNLSYSSSSNPTPNPIGSPTAFGLTRRPSQASLGTLGTVTSTIGTANMASGIAASHPDLPALITTKEVNETVASYNTLLNAAKKYRDALLQVSEAAADFGEALEGAARCKGAGASAEPLLSAGGLHYLVSNHQQILAKTIQRNFEQPVRKQVQQLRSATALNEDEFRRALKTKTKALRAHEADNLKLSKKRVRNLAAYRSSLLELTSQIDDIDRLKYEHFIQQFDLAQTTSLNILSYAAAVVRAEVEIYEGIARKGWSGGGLDDLISSGLDPFAPSEDEDEEEGSRNLYPSNKPPGVFSSTPQLGQGSANQAKPKKEFDIAQKLTSTFQNMSFPTLKDKGSSSDKKYVPPLNTQSSFESKKDNETATIRNFDTAQVKDASNHDESNSSTSSSVPNSKFYTGSTPVQFATTRNQRNSQLSSSSSASPESSPHLGILSSYGQTGGSSTGSSTGNVSAHGSFNSPWYGSSTTGINGTTVTAPTHHISSSSGGSSFGSGIGAALSSAIGSSILGLGDKSLSSGVPQTITSVSKPNHVKQSNGKGIFSVLPQTSILPKHGDEEKGRTRSVDYGRDEIGSLGDDSIDIGSEDYEEGEEEESEEDDEEEEEEGKTGLKVESSDNKSSNPKSVIATEDIDKETDKSDSANRSQTASQSTSIAHSNDQNNNEASESDSTTRNSQSSRSTGRQGTNNNVYAVSHESDSDDMMLGYSGWRNVRSLSLTQEAANSPASELKTVEEDKEKEKKRKRKKKKKKKKKMLMKS